MPDEPKTFDRETPSVTDEEVERLDPWDDGPPTTAQHGETHTRRPELVKAERFQGPKTRAANREKAKGSRLFNPR
ncbi:MAG TPA: hypothetical protein VG407_13100 [Caulobacteraceae bacterium]|jgi:hypothetical protein|nr:hypothetical protein [Caulobacteraceae bacterium]